MLDIRFVRENPEVVRGAIRDKHVSLDLDALLAADREASRLSRQLQELQEQRNQNAKRISALPVSERASGIEHGRKLGEQTATLKAELTSAESTLRSLLLRVPNVPAADAPRGASDADNVVVRTWGEPPRFEFAARDHVELLRVNGWYELDRIAKIAGSRSYGLRGRAVLLEQALLRYALDVLIERGFTPLSVPSFTNERALVGTGHFPDGRDQVYYIPEDEKFLSGTSEVTLNALHAGEILAPSELPLLYAGISTCFRRESGSAGRDVRGLIRVHQFNKIEQYVLCESDPSVSDHWHRFLLEGSESILQALEIPYRVVECCTGDMGLGKYKMFDIESWVPSEDQYRETHSCSNLRDWQARRTDLRYRDADGKVRFCHTLNNTAAATPRLLVPFLENHQRADGTVRVPEKLRPYLGGRESV